MSAISREIADLAERCGVALQYSSFWGEDKQVGEDVLRRALAAMAISPEQPPATTANAFPLVRVVAEGCSCRTEWRGCPLGI